MVCRKIEILKIVDCRKEEKGKDVERVKSSSSKLKE